jgi:hypothetical protein
MSITRKRPECLKKHNKIDYLYFNEEWNQSNDDINDSNPLHEQTGTNVHIVDNRNLFNCIYYSI